MKECREGHVVGFIGSSKGDLCIACGSPPKTVRDYSKYDDMFQCPLPCGCIVHVRYDFGTEVSRKHFEEARKSYMEQDITEPPKQEKLCKHCHLPIEIRNPSGYCDHLYYPEYCKVCQDMQKPPKQKIEPKDAYALEPGKVYLIKCQKARVHPNDVYQMLVELHKRSIRAVAIWVWGKDAITIAEKKK